MKFRTIRAAILSGAAMVLTWGSADLSAQFPANQPPPGQGGFQPGGPKKGPGLGQPGFQPGQPGFQPGQFGDPKKGPGLPAGFGFGAALAKPVVTALDANQDGKVSKDEFLAATQKFYKDCDKGNKGKIDEKAITDGANNLFGQPKFGPGPGIKVIPGGKGGVGGQPFPGPAPQPGFGPANPGLQPPMPPNGPAFQPGFQPGAQPGFQPGKGFPGKGFPPGKDQPPNVLMFSPPNILAKSIVKRVGMDKDITLEKFQAAAGAFFQECDKDKSGNLDEKEIAAGIDLLMPMPTFNFPPGFDPKGKGGNPFPPPGGNPFPAPPPGFGVPQPGFVPPGGVVPAPKQ